MMRSMKYPLLATQLYGVPLLLHPDKAAVIEAVFRAHAEGDAESLKIEAFHRPDPQAMAFAAPQFAGKPYVVTQGGVAVLPITGSLVHRTNGLNAASGLQSYQDIEQQFMRAVADPDVRAVMLEMDTSGGQSAGVFDLAQRMREAAYAAGKPLWAHANEMALSAGYAIAAAADRVLTAKTGALGSIGVVAMHVDQSKKNEKAGYTYTAIAAGAKKTLGSPHAPLSNEARQELQARVDEVYGHFVDHVAALRGLSPDAVRAQEASVYTGQAAVKAGLADAVMSFNEALAALEAQVSAPPAFSAGIRQSSKRGIIMDKEAVAEMLSAEQVAAQLAAARQEGAEQMQARIRAIMTCEESQGREKLAQHLAFNTSMSADEARALLAVSAKEAPPSAASQVNALAEAMAKLANPTVGADAPVIENDARAEAAALWQRSHQKLRAVK